MPFVKLDCGIIHSSLWAESSDTKICWITLLLLADQNGFVRAAPSAIAREAGIPAEVARKAISLFCSPDNESRSPENQGKRIERVEGGFHILNYEKYRERDYTNAERQKRWRESQKSNVTSVTEALPVTPRNTSRSRVQSTEVEERKRKPLSLADCVAYAKTIGISEQDAEAFFDSQEAGGWTRNGKALKNWQAAIRTWKANGWLPSQKQQNGQSRYIKAKEKAPIYPKMSEGREVSDEEFENARRIAREEIARFKEKFK